MKNRVRSHTPDKTKQKTRSMFQFLKINYSYIEYYLCGYAFRHLFFIEN